MDKPQSWIMWAGVDDDPRFLPEEDASETVYEHFSRSRFYPHAFGCESIVRVRLSEEPNGPYWGWLDAVSERHPAPEPSMVYRREVLFRVCFPYGAEAEEAAKRGRIVRLGVVPVDEQA